MSGEKKMSTKPPIPPKPHFMKTSIPKPPLKPVSRLPCKADGKNNDEEMKKDCQKSMEKEHYGNDGYLKPVLDERNSGVFDVRHNSRESSDNLFCFSAKTQEWGNSRKHVEKRPLPLLPGEKEDTNFRNMPWFKSVDRKKGEQLLSNGVNGSFLVRPSSKGECSLTLTLWYGGRPYNIPIRKRVDSMYALGTFKDHELTFCTIEQMIEHYKVEQLILYSNGMETGKTKLSFYPPL